MKKIFKFASMAAFALAMGACSSDTLDVAQDSTSVFDKDGNGYVKIAINLPSTTTTRGIGDLGDGYGEFNDGIQNEYTVENATLCVFSGKDGEPETSYELIGAYSLADAEWNKDGSNNQVSTNRVFVQKINAGETTDNKLYAYVILNRHDFFHIDGDKLYFSSGKTGEPRVDLTGKNVGYFASLDLRESGRRYDANSFLMTNMPYVTRAGGKASESPLGTGFALHNVYPLDGAIYSSRTEAEKPDAQAAEINVERVLAKVETNLTSTTLETENNKHKFKFLGWFVDNTNPNAYVARHSTCPNHPSTPYDYLAYRTATSSTLMDGAQTYRMVSESPVSSTQQGRFRTFWAVDANYNENAFGRTDGNNLINEGGKVVDTRLMKWENGVNVGGRLRASGSYYYCTENTFDVQHQSESNTTRIVVAAQFTEDDGVTPKSFYTISTEADKMFTKENLIKYATGRVANRIAIQEWAHEYLASTANAADYIIIEVKEPTVTVNSTTQIESGRCELTVKNLTALPDAALQDATKKSAAITRFNALIADEYSKEEGHETEVVYVGHNTYLKENVISDFYKEGISYYQALIKHYGDYETPWSETDHAGKPNTVGDIYDNNNVQKYLGRYGVVRNNWYKIDVTGIRQIGSAVVPVVPGKNPLDPNDPDTPDDTVENYLKVKVNIMPWAIRKQSVIL